TCAFRLAMPFVFQQFRKLFVLIAGDIVSPGLRSSAPAFLGRSTRTKIVGAKPPEAAQFLCGSAIQRIKADPQTASMSMVDQCSQALLVFRCPIASLGLPTALDHAPRVIPPAPIITYAFWGQGFGGRHRIGSEGVHGSESQQFFPDGDFLVKHF